MDERDDLYEKIVEEYKATGSVKQVVENLKTNTIKVRRVLITEGLWESESSRQVGELYAEGKSVKEIAEVLCMSEKNVQSYMPYTKGAYGGTKSDTAERSEEYRGRQKKAAESQVGRQHRDNVIDISDRLVVSPEHVEINSEDTKPVKKMEDSKNPHDRLPSVLKLRFELVAPYYTHKGSMDMDPDEEREFLKLAKAEKGIIRDVLVPGEMTLHAMHYMIQKLFGWQNSHLHNFCVSESDFEMLTDKQRAEQYFELCGTLFRFPGAEMDDQFWDDDYEEGRSFKTWLRHKYTNGFYDLAVENTYLRNRMNVEEFRNRMEKEFKNSKKITLKDLQEKIIFEDPFNTVLESIPVRNIFKNASPEFANLTHEMWKDLEEVLMVETKRDYENFSQEDPERYEGITEAMQELIDLRKNVLQIDEAIRYGREKEVRKFYKEDPRKVILSQKKLIKTYEGFLLPVLSHGNPAVIPFAEELFYVYDYGDDWCVKITLVDSYTANEDYDRDYYLNHISADGKFIDERKIRPDDLQYKNLDGQLITGELRDKLQSAYIYGEPVCVYADGINVMDDVGGLYGFQDFLRTINSKDPDDTEEKESSKIWAKGMGWNGRKVKSENIL